MPKEPITLIKGDSVGFETDYRDYLPVNMYAVPRQILGAAGYMIEYPGLELVNSAPGIDRGSEYNERQKTQFRVSGQSLITFNEDGTTTNLGTIIGNDQVSLPYSFNTQAIIASGSMYLYDPSNGLRTVEDPDLGNVIDGVWIDGYYFMTDGDFLFHTELNNESSINPLAFATAEFMPDPSLGVGKTQDNKVLVFGRYTLEYFVSSPASNFAFQRLETRGQKIGIVATHAKVEVGPSFYICGSRKGESLGIHEVSIGRSTKVSTREVDKVLEQYSDSDLTNMRMETRSEKNVVFVIVHLPNETLLFNVTLAASIGIEQAWSIIKTGNQNDNYPAINGVYDPRLGKWYYGDKSQGRIGLLNDTLATNYGELSEWELATPFINIEKSSINEIEIETLPGHGANDDGSVFVSITYDGLTYGKEYIMQYGQPDQYRDRFIRYRFGYVRDWFGFKFRGASTTRMAFSIFSLDYG